MSSVPPLSVVVVPLLGHSSSSALLSELERHADLPPGSEVILVSEDETPVPGARLVVAPRGSTVPERRGLGLKAATGDVIDAKVIDQNGTSRQAAETIEAIRASRFRPKFVNGEPVASGSSDDVMNGPLWVLAWVAGFARDAGTPLQPGQWIMTGSIIPTRFAVSGDTYSFQLGSLPQVAVTIE